MSFAQFAGVLPAMVDDLRELVTCESPSTDHDALARSAEVVAAQGARLLGQAPEPVVVEGRTHLRWRFGAGPSRVVLVGTRESRARNPRVPGSGPEAAGSFPRTNSTGSSWCLASVWRTGRLPG